MAVFFGTVANSFEYDCTSDCSVLLECQLRLTTKQLITSWPACDTYQVFLLRLEVCMVLG